MAEAEANSFLVKKVPNRREQAPDRANIASNATSYCSPSTSTLALNPHCMDVNMVPMPTQIDVPDYTESPQNDLLTKGIAAQIKTANGGKSNKTYFENLFMMKVALHLDSTTTKDDNIVYCRKKIFGIVCKNGYILIPRCEVALFKSLRSWKFCSSSMKPDVVIFYHPVTYLFSMKDKFQKQARRLLKEIKSCGVPLLYIEEQSSTIMQTSLCCAFRLVEHHRLLRSIGIATGELLGFAFPRQTEPEGTDVTTAVAVNFSDDDDDQSTEETEGDSSIIEDTSQQPSKKKAKVATAPIKISVKWVVEDLTLRTTYQALEYGTVWTALNDAVESAKNMLLQNSSFDVDSSFLFKLTEQELQKVITANLVKPPTHYTQNYMKAIYKELHECKSLDWLTDGLTIVQLPSGPSFVFKLASKKSNPQYSCIVKYFVHAVAEYKFLRANSLLKSVDTQRFCLPIVAVKGFYIFEQLLPPLAIDAAKPCMQNLCTEVRNSLQIMHSLYLAHLDVRLPNICYRHLTDDMYIPVLIDYERVDSASDCSAHLYVSHDLYPSGLKNMYIDYVQLFTMASSTKDFISSFVKQALQLNFSSEALDKMFNTFISQLPEDTQTIRDVFNSRE